MMLPENRDIALGYIVAADSVGLSMFYCPSPESVSDSVAELIVLIDSFELIDWICELRFSSSLDEAN